MTVEDVSPALLLNALPVTFGFHTLPAWSRDIHEGEDPATLRATLRGDWFVYWHAGVVFLLPLKDGLMAPSGFEEDEIEAADHLQLLARLVTESLVRRFSDYEPLRRKPFVFIGRRNQLLESVPRTLGVTNPLVSEFRVWPKYELDGRVLQVDDQPAFVAVTVDVATRWEIGADLTALATAGVDLGGLWVVKRSPQPDARRLVGRIGRLRDGTVELSESTDVSTDVKASDVMIEGRRDAFLRCLTSLLGPDLYRQYQDQLDKKIGGLLGGPQLLNEVRRVAGLLSQTPLPLTPTLSAAIGNLIQPRNSKTYKSVVTARLLDYCFDPARSKRHRYAWPGLELHGPFSRDTFARPSPTILVVCPAGAKGAVETFVRRLRDGMPDVRPYRGGLAKTFGLVNPRFEFALVQPGPNTPAARYRSALVSSLSRNDLPDAALVVVMDAEAELPAESNPYLHSKATLLMAGVAAQEIRLSTATKPSGSLGYILQNVSIALYAKMKGVPWTVDHDLAIADELVIGVGTAELSESRVAQKQRYVGITTVFRGDGNYLLGQLAREAGFDEYPQVLRDSTRSVIQEIKERNGWQPGDTVRIIFHATRPPRNVDFARLMRESVEAVGADQHVEFAFVTVSHEHPFVVFDPNQAGRMAQGGRKGQLTPDRGLIVQTGVTSRLVTTSAVSLVKRPGLPLSRPIQVRVHRESTFSDIHYLAEQVLKFTALSWRSTTPAADPVTIYYSELIAGLLGRLKAVPGWSPALLDIRLRTSKWFL